jgi:NitT/TauT family transport system substrate-binding protein
MPIIPSRREFLVFSAMAAVAATAPPPVRAQTTTLRVGYIPIIPMTQLFIMEGEGWTREAGLKLDLTSFSSGPAMIQALASNSLDVAYVGIGPAMLARSRGIDIKVLASNIIEQVALIGQGLLPGILAQVPSSPSEGFHRFRQQTGRPAKIATLPQGSVPDSVLRYYLQVVAKVAPEDVEIVGVGEEQVQQSLLAGAVDGASILEPILTIVQERDPTAQIVAPAAAMLPRQPGAVVAVREAAIAANRAAVAKLVELHVKATQFSKAEPEKTAQHVTAFVGKGLVDPSIIAKALRSPSTNLVADPHIIVESTRLLQDFQQSLGVQIKPVNLDELFDHSFYNAVVRA